MCFSSGADFWEVWWISDMIGSAGLVLALYFHLVSYVLIQNSWSPIGLRSRSWLDTLLCICVSSGMIKLLPKTGRSDLDRVVRLTPLLWLDSGTISGWGGYFRKRRAGILERALKWVGRFPYMTKTFRWSVGTFLQLFTLITTGFMELCYHISPYIISKQHAVLYAFKCVYVE